MHAWCIYVQHMADETVARHLPLRPVEFHILLSLAAGERHGYGIIQDIEARGDAAVPDVGTMYRALARMVESRTDRSGGAPAGARRGRRAPQLLPHHGRRACVVATRRGAAARSADAGRAHRRPAAEGGEMTQAIAS